MRNIEQTAEKFEFRNCESGFGLIEVVIAAAILSVVALGVTTLVEDMLRVQRKANTVSVVNNMRSVITSTVQNGASWEATVANGDAGTGNGTSMDCLRAATPAATCAINTEFPISLINPSLNPSVPLVYNGIAANHGFQFDGQLCYTYPSDSCAFRWVLTWSASCPGAAASCHDPNVTVSGNLEYTAGSSGPLPGGFNPKLYSFRIVRGSEAIRNDAVVVAFVQSTGEGGGCNVGPVTRKLNTVIADPGNNLINKAGGAVSPADRVNLRAGTYNCRIQAPAFKNGGNRLVVHSTAGTSFPDITSSIATASMNGGSANLLVETTLILNADTTFIIQQTCTGKPSDDADGFGSVDDTWTLGVPIPGASGTYTDATYTTVTCARTS